VASNDLNVRIDATTAGFDAGIARARTATTQYDRDLARLNGTLLTTQQRLDRDVAAALERQHSAMTKVGKTMLITGAVIAGGLALATNAAMKWESAWAGVTKTVDGSQAEMDQLEGGLRSLATTLPATHEEIAAVAEAAGQLGIKRDAIIGFTKTMIDLSETTNLTADQAATDMARFANIMATPQDEVDRLGASLVALGNDGASTEADILAMAMRIAGAAHQLDFTEGEVLGLANALSSVGIEAEAGGSAISMVMKNIQLAVSAGGDGLEAFARVAGMSAQEFSAQWGQSAAKGLNAFITGLANIKASGGDVISVLAEMGVTQIRQSDALLRLAGAGDILTDSLNLGNQAWADNSALLNEANKRYETTEAKVQIAQNSLRDAAITAGQVLLPALAAVATTVTNMARAWQDLPGPLKTSVVVLSGLAAVLLLVGGAALIAVPKIYAFKVAVDALEAGALKTAGTRLLGMGSILAGPWGLALAAGVTALGFFAAKQGEAARSVDALKATLDEQTGAISDNSREWAIKELSDKGVLSAAKDMGLNLGMVTDAALGNTDAMASLNEQLALADTLIQAQSSQGQLLGGQDAANNLDKIRGALSDTNGTLLKSREAWALEHEAKVESAGGSDKATDAQQGTTQAWQDGADAASGLTEEVTTLLQVMEDLSGTFLSEREASRSVRSSLRDVRDALHEYVQEHGNLRNAFKAGSKSGDDFEEMLDSLAKDYQKQIDATANLTGSEQKTIAVYREARANLVKVADQLGMTRAQAKAYADQILGTPDMIRTHFVADTSVAMSHVEALRAELASIANNPYYINVHVRMPSLSGLGPQISNAKGGLVEYAGGGIAANGARVPRVPQIARGGMDIRWAEPGTGWEAYISGKPGFEARNREIWMEAGRRLGLVGRLEQAMLSRRGFSHGGFAGATTGGSGSAHMTVSGVLATPWGPARIEGIARNVAREEIEAEARYQDSRA